MILLFLLLIGIVIIIIIVIDVLRDLYTFLIVVSWYRTGTAGAISVPS
jgi:hypothetical protein